MQADFKTSLDHELWLKDGFAISINKAYLDVDLIHDFLANESYWAERIPKELVIKAIENTALCFGVYQGIPGEPGSKQVGLGRVITDLATFAYLADVFIIKDYRGQGLAKWMLSILVATSELQKVRNFYLGTADAQSLYAKFGFEVIEQPPGFMRIFREYD